MNEDIPLCLATSKEAEVLWNTGLLGRSRLAKCETNMPAITSCKIEDRMGGAMLLASHAFQTSQIVPTRPKLSSSCKPTLSPA